MTDTPYWRKGFDTRKKHVDKAWKEMKDELKTKIEDITNKEDLKDFKSSLSNLEKQVEEMHSYCKDIVKDVNEFKRYVREMPLFKDYMKLTAEWNAKDGIIEINDNK